MALGIDFDRDRHLRREEEWEAWEAAIAERAAELQDDDPDLGEQEAGELAEELLHREIKEREERAAEETADREDLERRPM